MMNKNDDEYLAFYLNDESDPDDEFSPVNLDIDLKRFNNTDEETSINPET